jgi:ribosomal protein S8
MKLQGKQYNTLSSFISQINRNVQKGMHKFVIVTSKNTIPILEALYRYGYLNFHITDTTIFGRYHITVTISYIDEKLTFRKLKKISTPGIKIRTNAYGDTNHKKYSFFKKDPHITYFYSTTKGIFTSETCAKLHLGGEILFSIE